MSIKIVSTHRRRDRRRRRALHSNFLKIYALGFFFGLHLVVAIFVPLLQSHGLAMSQILLTQAIFALTVAALELPSGYLADHWGRKNALIAGSIVSALGFGLLVRANSFEDFIVFEILMGIAVSLCSGADLALLYDTQAALGKRFKRETGAKTFARLLSTSSVAECFAGLLATLLLFWSLEWLLFFQLCISLVPIAIACSLVEAPHKVTVGNTNSGRRKNLSALLFEQQLLLWIGVAIVAFGLVGLYAFWLHQKYWELAGIDIRFFGCIWAMFCLVRAIAAQFAERAEAYLGPQRLLLAVCCLPIIALLGMAIAPPLLGIALSLLFPLARGLGYVVLIDALNARISSVFRATINSLISLVSRAAFIVTGPLLGWSVDAWGVRSAVVILLLVVTPLLVTVTYQLLRSIGNDNDKAAANKGSTDSVVMDKRVVGHNKVGGKRAST